MKFFERKFILIRNDLNATKNKKTSVLDISMLYGCCCLDKLEEYHKLKHKKAAKTYIPYYKKIFQIF